MNDFTKEEIQELNVMMNRDLYSCIDVRRANIFHKKIQSMIDNYCEHNYVYTHNPELCPHDYRPASVSQWGHQFNQCIKCGKIE